jgi:hypothetical protein
VKRTKSGIFRLQSKDINDYHVLELIERIESNESRWTFTWDIHAQLQYPMKLVRAKASSLVRRGLISGCACGCRGDFELSYKGEEYLKSLRLNEALAPCQEAEVDPEQAYLAQERL